MLKNTIKNISLDERNNLKAQGVGDDGMTKSMAPIEDNQKLQSQSDNSLTKGSKGTNPLGSQAKTLSTETTELISKPPLHDKNETQAQQNNNKNEKATVPILPLNSEDLGDESQQPKASEKALAEDASRGNTQPIQQAPLNEKDPRQSTSPLVQESNKRSYFPYEPYPHAQTEPNYQQHYRTSFPAPQFHRRQSEQIPTRMRDNQHNVMSPNFTPRGFDRIHFQNLNSPPTNNNLPNQQSSMYQNAYQKIQPPRHVHYPSFSQPRPYPMPDTEFINNANISDFPVYSDSAYIFEDSNSQIRFDTRDSYDNRGNYGGPYWSGVSDKQIYPQGANVNESSGGPNNARNSNPLLHHRNSEPTLNQNPYGGGFAFTGPGGYAGQMQNFDPNNRFDGREGVKYYDQAYYSQPGLSHVEAPMYHPSMVYGNIPYIDPSQNFGVITEESERYHQHHANTQRSDKQVQVNPQPTSSTAIESTQWHPIRGNINSYRPKLISMFLFLKPHKTSAEDILHPLYQRNRDPKNEVLTDSNR